MPQLDVTTVLNSVNLSTRFTVIRRASTVDSQGRTSATSEEFTAIGVICAWGENSQERPREYAAGRKSIAVYTRFRLYAQSQGVIPDLIVYRGNTFLVQALQDFSEYGRGFVQAYCTSEELQDAPPQQ